jgi:osmoprotectant transport system permease protein
MQPRLQPTLWIGAAYVALLAATPHLEPIFARAFPDVPRPLYSRASFLQLALAHLELVASGTLAAAVIGIGVAVFVTRQRGRPFLALAGALAAIGQTFPPVAVLALAVPLLGYGEVPTIAALGLYAILPILESTVAGLHAVPAATRDAARGLGFSAGRMLLAVEMPLAAPFILTGLRTAVIVNIGTATIGSSVGALSLGSPIIEGLSASNPAYVVEGAVAAAGLAIVCDLLLETLQDWLAFAQKT